MLPLVDNYEEEINKELLLDIGNIYFRLMLI